MSKALIAYGSVKRNLMITHSTIIAMGSIGSIDFISGADCIQGNLLNVVHSFDARESFSVGTLRVR